MKYRKLRIAWSVGCGIVCLLLIALWVRSYWCRDQVVVQHRSRNYVHIASEKGRCAILHDVGDISPTWSSWDSWSLDLVQLEMFPFNTRPMRGWKGFDAYWFSTTVFGAFVPHWFLAVVVGGLAVIPWIRRRFSLRTLLIGMTVVAALLGAVVWTSR